MIINLKAKFIEMQLRSPPQRIWDPLVKTLRDKGKKLILRTIDMGSFDRVYDDPFSSE